MDAANRTTKEGMPLMSLRQIKACGHLLLGTLQLRCEHHGSGEDPRQEMIAARVFVKKRLREIPVTEDRNDKDYVLRALYTTMDSNFAVIFNKIGQVSGELAFLATIYNHPEFANVELQFVWTCDYLFTSGQLENELRGDFAVPNTPWFEMPSIDDMPVEEQIAFEIESEEQLLEQLEHVLAIEENLPSIEETRAKVEELEAP